jgi:hypothetical protein
MRFLLDANRRNAELTAASFESPRYPSEQRMKYLRARWDLAYLPRFGPSGGVLQRLATMSGTTRSYVDQVLYPEQVGNMWNSDAESVKIIWDSLYQFTQNHPLLYNQSIPARPDSLFKLFFIRTLSGHPVRIQVNNLEWRFLERRLTEFGSKFRVDREVSQTPTAYLVTPANKVCDDGGIPLPEPVFLTA